MIHQFPCKQCGAKVDYDPTAGALKCPYCSAEIAVPQEASAAGAPAVAEQDYEAWLTQAQHEGETVEHLSVHCSACGAVATLADNVVADVCPFCGANIVATGESQRIIKPGGVLPFRVDRTKAEADFGAWIRSRWFAPSALTRMARRDGKLTGLYVPFWTYDCDTTSDYTGERGEDYTTTETYTVVVNGKSQLRTRMVTKTRWWPASGTVRVPFDDLLIPASRSLPRNYLDKLEPWDLVDLEPYRDDFLSGFRAELQQVPLAQGFAEARNLMTEPIQEAIRRNIGGDHQRISSVETRCNDITFKHLLLPLWICAYRYRDKAYRVLINARTGEVQGERPYSAFKIALLVLLILAAILIVAAIATSRAHGAGGTHFGRPLHPPQVERFGNY